MSNGLTPMGKQLSQINSDKLKFWDDNTRKAAKLVKQALFCVLTVDSKWLQKGYINPSSEMCFDNEHDAIQYVDNWHKSNKGCTKILTPKC